MTARAMDEASRRQAMAADPGVSAWVSANAGSGKTRVLTDRVARLLLAGARPEKILCLTYTKAAAAEMQERLFALLGRWAMMDAGALRAELQSRAVEELDLSDEVLAAARRLFASALETPGGLKIQTIHAFCEKLLRRFPLEAGISPRFEVLDDREAARIRAAVRERMAQAAAAGEDPAFDAAAARISEFSLDRLDLAIMHARELFDDAPDMTGALDLPDLPLDALWEEAAACLDMDGLADLAEALGTCGKRAQGYVPKIRAILEAMNGFRAEEAARMAGAALLKKDGEPYSAPWLLGKKKAEEDPWVVESYAAAAADAQRAAEMARSIDALAKSRDLVAYASAFLAGYEAEKTARSALDFTDLIDRARDLVSTSEAAAWALYKLDGGVDHILIDEAQDTAPDQWAVIRTLAEEFFAGEGAARGPGPARTLFVVGDEKQSIYSFQGAEPREFGRMRAHFRERLAQTDRRWHEEPLQHSFRSAPAILTLADAVFAERHDGLSSDGAPPRHIAFRGDAPGLAELWPFFGKMEEAEEPAWDDPVDAPAAVAPRQRLITAVCEHVEALIHEGAPIPDHKAPGGWRPMRAGDVMILLRRRAGLAPGLIRGLKARGVDVSGADRMVLTEELAAQDLLALLRVAQDPGDDLSLAALLRSPLGRMTEQGLFALAHARSGRLRDALREARGAAPEAHALVEEAIAAADYQRPHELLSRALRRGAVVHLEP